MGLTSTALVLLAPVAAGAATGRSTPAGVRLTAEVARLEAAGRQVATILDVLGCAQDVRSMAGAEAAAHQISTCRPAAPGSPYFPTFVRNPGSARFAVPAAGLEAFAEAGDGRTWPPPVRRDLMALKRVSARLSSELRAPGPARSAPGRSGAWSVGVERSLERLQKASRSLLQTLGRPSSR